jgi:hypothetical protein
LLNEALAVREHANDRHTRRADGTAQSAVDRSPHRWFHCDLSTAAK